MSSTRGQLSLVKAFDTGGCPDPGASSPAPADVKGARRASRSDASAPLTSVGRGEHSDGQRAATLPHGGMCLAVCVGGAGVQVGVEYIGGRWPSLVLETAGGTVQIDLDDGLTRGQVRQAVAAVATATEEWFDMVLGTGGCGA